MKKFWKVLGLTALAAGLTPYKVEKDPETGERSYQSLLVRVTSAPGQEEGEKRRIGINLGEGTLTSKLLDMTEKKEEPHLFSDEISVEYAAAKSAPIKEEASDAEEEVEKIAKAVEAAEPEESAEPATPEKSEEPAEPAEDAEIKE